MKNLLCFFLIMCIAVGSHGQEPGGTFGWSDVARWVDLGDGTFL